GGVLAGFEHRDGWGGADRGLVGGALFGLGLLIAHAIAGTHAKVSLGGFPPFLIVIDAIAGMFLGALGGRLGRMLRWRSGAVSDARAVAAFARATEVDVAMVSADEPLAAGVVDALLAQGTRAVGPTRAGAEIEWNKAFARALLNEVAPQAAPAVRVVRQPQE